MRWPSRVLEDAAGLKRGKDEIWHIHLTRLPWPRATATKAAAPTRDATNFMLELSFSLVRAAHEHKLSQTETLTGSEEKLLCCVVAFSDAAAKHVQRLACLTLSTFDFCLDREQW